jgi:hypothetical protein
MIDKKVFRLIADAVADNVGVTLQKSPSGEWMADVTSKTIYYPSNKPLYQSDLGYLIHEAAHLRFTEISEGYDESAKKILKKHGKNPNQFHDLLNALEDIRVNKQIVKVYKGAKKYLDLNYGLTYDLVYEDMYKMKMMNPAKYQEEWGSNLIKQFGYAVGFEMELSKTDAEIFMWEFCEDKVYIAYDKTIKAIYEIPKLKSTVELYEHIIKKILPHCLPLFDDWDEKKEEEEKEKQRKDFEKMLDELLKALKKAVAEIKVGKKKAGKQKLSRGVRPKTEEEKETEEKKPVKVFGGTGRLTAKDLKDIFKEGHLRPEDLKLSELNDFVNQALPGTKNAISILKDLEFERWESGYRSGRIDKTRLRKIFVGSDRIFQKKLELKDENKDMAIAILVDESGSMNRGYGNDPKSIHACKAVGVLAKALEQANRPYAVYGFNDKFFIHKNWKQRLSLQEILKIDHNARKDGAGYNNDGYAIWKVSQELRKRPERNKVIIVFSDGLPAPGCGSCPERNKRYRDYDLTTEAQEAEKIAKVYSFGIMTDAVSRFYKRWKEVSDPAELPAEMTKIFKENVGRRDR